jgi:hypothetical protein
MKIFNWTREDGTPTREWCRDDMRGTHTALPLDASEVPDAVVDRVAKAMCDNLSDNYPEVVRWERQSGFGRTTYRGMATAAIAALAAALGEEG